MVGRALTVMKCAPRWQPFFFMTSSVALTVATYADNAFALDDTPQCAINILDDLAAELNATWSLDTKPDSREVLVGRASQTTFVSPMCGRQCLA